MSELMEESMDSFIQHISQEHNAEYITPSAGKLAEGFFLFVEKMWKAVKCCGIIEMLSNLQQKGGDAMEYIIRFLVSVMASVTGYYIRKWLDRNDKDS